jgi:hypothetical protein
MQELGDQGREVCRKHGGGAPAVKAKAAIRAEVMNWGRGDTHVDGFISRDGPSALYADAVRDGRFTQTPAVGDMIFIDLFGPDGVGHGQVTHVGIVEAISGDELTIIQGNGKPDPSLVTRTT